MATTMTAQQLIDLSITETRIVTEYPETVEEQETLDRDLLAVADYEDSVYVSGAGFSDPERRGYTEYWGTDGNSYTWRVRVVNAPGAE